MSEVLPSMRPKVKADTYFLPNENGVFFRNNEGSFRMEGRTIYQWIETLIPMLDGEQTIQEMTEGLSEAQSRHVYDIVQVLYENGFLRDAALALPHHLPASVMQRYAHQIAFLDALSDSGGQRFEWYRQAQVLVVGGGVMLTSAVAALYESGLPRVSVCVAQEEGTDRKRLLELATHARTQDSMVELNEIVLNGTAGLEPTDDWERVLAPFQGVVCVCEKEGLSTLFTLESICKAHGKHLAPVVLLERTGLLGPLVRPGQGEGFEDTWRRLHRSALEPTARETRVRSFTAAAMLANVAVFELMKALAGVLEGDERQHLFLLDLETMEGDWHDLPPTLFGQNGCRIAHNIDLGERMKEYRDPVSTANLLGLFSGITSRVAGMFHRWEEGDLIQLPLSQCLVEVTDPAVPGPTMTMVTRVEFGMTHEEARVRAGLAGLEEYATKIWEFEAGAGPVVEGRPVDWSSSRAKIGAGRTVAEAVLRGLGGYLTHQLQMKVTDSQLTITPVTRVDVQGERLGFFWQTLCSVEPQPGIGLGPLVCGFQSVWIQLGPLWHGAVATTLSQAFAGAVQQALSAVQNGENTRDLVPGCVRVAKEQVQLDDPVQLLVAGGPDHQPEHTVLQEALGQLHKNGHHLVVDELLLRPAFAQTLAGVFAVTVCKEEQR